MDNIKSYLLILGCVGFLQGCNTLAYTNKPLAPNSTQQTSKANFKLQDDRGQWGESPQDKTLFVLALSGGGSRAAIWSAAAMLKMQTLFAAEGIDLLAEVDGISSISGGSMTAAYYAISADDESGPWYQTDNGARFLWEGGSVKQQLSKNFLIRWFGNWFWPHNMFRFWLTAYDRTDIMAKTLADNLFDSQSGYDFTVGDINPDRPNIILNATISSGDNFSEAFSYTHEDFQTMLCSNVNDYDLSRAVMGSAAFPAAFNSMTLRDYRTGKAMPGCGQNLDKKAYLHVIDGGSHDNLGLRSAVRFLKENEQDYQRIAVILIDAYTPPVGLNTKKANPRNPLDYLVDTNFMDSVNALMDRNRNKVLDEMRRYLSAAEAERGKQIEFYHATFESIDSQLPYRYGVGSLREAIYNVRTSLKIGSADIAAIEAAVDHLFVRENPCLQKIARLISGQPMPHADDIYHGSSCSWSNMH